MVVGGWEFQKADSLRTMTQKGLGSDVNVFEDCAGERRTENSEWYTGLVGDVEEKDSSGRFSVLRNKYEASHRARCNFRSFQNCTLASYLK